MNIRHFITFKKVAELNSFTKASEVLGYSQSSITAHIQALETEFNVSLFDRIGKKIELTPKGNQLLAHVNELLDSYSKIESIVRDNEIPNGSIRIGVPETLMLYRLDTIFKNYKQKFPNVTIIIENTPSSRLVEALHRGELDLAFILDHEVVDPDLQVSVLMEERMCLIHPPSLSYGVDSAFPNDLSIFMTEKGCSYRYIFDQYLRLNNIPTNNTLEAWSVEIIKKCVINGLGISLLPQVAVYREHQNGSLIALPVETEKKIYTQIAYHQKKWLSPTLKSFIELTIENSSTWQESTLCP